MPAKPQNERGGPQHRRPTCTRDPETLCSSCSTGVQGSLAVLMNPQTLSRVSVLHCGCTAFDERSVIRARRRGATGKPTSTELVTALATWRTSRSCTASDVQAPRSAATCASPRRHDLSTSTCASSTRSLCISVLCVARTPTCAPFPSPADAYQRRPTPRVPSASRTLWLGRMGVAIPADRREQRRAYGSSFARCWLDEHPNGWRAAA